MMLVTRGHGAAEAAEPDPAYAAFQRGYYLTAFAQATEHVETKKDVKAMTLLGELYAGGLGVRQDDAKAADWYKLAADRGDRNAMFALAMFRLQGRAGPRDRDAAAKLLAAAAKLSHAVAAYDLALLYIEGQLFPQVSTVPPNCCAALRWPAVRKRNMRSARSTSRAAACPRI
jgi:uncharacterized protein